MDACFWEDRIVLIIIHIVWIIDVYTHVKIFTLVLVQVRASMMLPVHIFYIYCNIFTRHICDIYVHIFNLYVTDIYVTYMSVAHIITICLLPHLHLKYKYVTYISQLYVPYISHIILTYMFHIVFFRKGNFSLITKPHFASQFGFRTFFSFLFRGLGRPPCRVPLQVQF